MPPLVGCLAAAGELDRSACCTKGELHLAECGDGVPTARGADAARTARRRGAGAEDALTALVSGLASDGGAELAPPGSAGGHAARCAMAAMEARRAMRKDSSRMGEENREKKEKRVQELMRKRRERKRKCVFMRAARSTETMTNKQRERIQTAWEQERHREGENKE